MPSIELVRHAAQRPDRNAELEQTIKRERDVDGDLRPRHPDRTRLELRLFGLPSQRGRDLRQQGGHELAPACGVTIVDVQHHEAAFRKALLSVGAKNIALDIRKIECDRHAMKASSDADHAGRPAWDGRTVRSLAVNCNVGDERRRKLS